jgi:hypothetical protein
MRILPLPILAGLCLLAASARGAEPLFYFDLNTPQETHINGGLLKGLALRLVNNQNHLENLVGEQGSGVSGESFDRCAILKDGACMELLEGKGGQPLLDNSPAFTFSGWIKSDSFSENGRWPILIRNLSAESKGGISLAVSPDGRPVFAFGSPSGEVVKTEWLAAKWLVPDEEWQFFAVTFDGDVVRYYSGSKSGPVVLSGEQAAPVERVPVPPNPNTGLFGQHGGSDTLRGHVDNIRLFDSPLGEEELEQLRKGDVADEE